MNSKILCLILLNLSTTLYAQTTLSQYSLSVTANPTTKTLQGHETILFQNPFQYPIKKCYIRLSNQAQKPNPFLPDFAQDIGYKNGFEESGISITNIESEQKKLTYRFIQDPRKIKKFSIDQTLCEIELSTTLNIGESLPITLDFITKIPEVYSIDSGEEKWALNDTYILRSNWYPIEATHTKEQWDFESSTPQTHQLKTCTFTVPRGYTIALSGDTTTTTQNALFTTTTSSFKTPIDTMSVAFSKHFTETSLQHNQTQLLIYSPLPSYASEIQLIKQACLDALDTYTQKFGPLQNQRILIINSPIRGLWGMAANGFIILGDTSFGSANMLVPRTLDRIIEYLVAHELGHQWAGIGTVIDFGSENVLSEGLTDYLAITHFEEKYGRESNLNDAHKPSFSKNILAFISSETRLKSFTLSDTSHINYIQNVRDGFDEPVIQKAENSIINSRQTRDYNKGYLLFTTLENYIGKEALEKGLHRYFNENKYQPVTTETLKQALQKETALPLDIFFQKWFYESSQIDFSIKNITATNITIKKTGTAPSGLDVDALYENNITHHYHINETTSDMNLPITSNQHLKGIILDPNSRILETNKQNNKTVNNLDLYALYNVNERYKRHPQENYLINLGVFSTPFFTGIGLSGTDDTTHQWTLSPESTGTAISPKATWTWLLPRNQYATLSAIPNGTTWDIGFDYILPLFSTVETGYYGHYLYPTSQISFTTIRKEFTTRFQYIDIQNGWIGTTSLKLESKNTNAFQVSVTKALRLLPNIILAPRLGYSNNSKTNIRGYEPTSKEDGNQFATASLDMLFPIVNDLSINVASLFKIRSLSGSIFRDIEIEWPTNKDVSKQTHHTIGAELGILLTTIADIPIPLVIGYAHLLDSKPALAEDTYYISLQTPLSLYALVFGH